MPWGLVFMGIGGWVVVGDELAGCRNVNKTQNYCKKFLFVFRFLCALLHVVSFLPENSRENGTGCWWTGMSTLREAGLLEVRHSCRTSGISPTAVARESRQSTRIKSEGCQQSGLASQGEPPSRSPPDKSDGGGAPSLPIPGRDGGPSPSVALAPPDAQSPGQVGRRRSAVPTRSPVGMAVPRRPLLFFLSRSLRSFAAGK
jgi:hypothetical protein